MVGAGGPECSELRASYDPQRGAAAPAGEAAVADRAASLEVLTLLLSSGASSNSPESSSSRILGGLVRASRGKSGVAPWLDGREGAGGGGDGPKQAAVVVLISCIAVPRPQQMQLLCCRINVI